MNIRRIAIVHYHSRPGGVTRVMDMTRRMLDEAAIRSVTLCGDVADDHHEPEADRTVVIPELGYGAPDNLPVAGRALRAALETAAAQALGGPPDVWHIHNHSLGKNPALTWAVYELARAGQPLLLQIHDFAEDGRPALYRNMYRMLVEQGEDPDPILYPRGSRVHYALLNRRDQNILTTAGMPESQTHYLPNPVVASEPLPPATGKRYLYPVRGIRRKNLGECLLLAALFDGAAEFAVTLAPQNPEQRPAYTFWVERSRALGLPVAFDVGGHGAPLRSLLQSSRAALSTSITEGFGLGFVEPWLQGRPLVGRDLPEITDDFRRAGIHLDHLYARLDVPTAAFDGPAFAGRLRDAYAETCRAYGRVPKTSELEMPAMLTIGEQMTDYGCLDETAQAQVLDKVAHHGATRDRIGAPDSLLKLPSEQVISANAARIRDTYDARMYLKRLLKIYRAMPPEATREICGIQSSRILDQFLTPERFLMLKA